MTEITRKGRIMAATRKEQADKLPFFHYWRHSQIGWAERQCRNRGMGMNWMRPPFTVKHHGIEIQETQAVISGEVIIRRTYSTPVGQVYEDEKRDPGVGQWHANRSWNDVLPWQTERLIKKPEDYEVLKYIVTHTEYIADYFPIEQALDWLGEDGVVMDALPHSPMQMLMIHWVGSEGGRFFYHHADYPDLIDDLYQAISKSREPLYAIAAKSPAPIALCGDNIDGVLANPNLFRKYFMPEYEKQGKILHQHGKLMAVHMDGRIDVLKDLIPQTPIDIIEALHPPPMGDLSIGEALARWPDKIIWVGFPGSAYMGGPEKTQKAALELLREIGTGERLAIAMSTENLVTNENLQSLTAVLEKVTLPLTPEKIDNIERALI